MTPSKVIVACDSFKGTLSSREAGEALARGLRAAGLTAEVVRLADGGEGLVDVLASQVKGALMVGAPCRDPLQKPRTARFASLPGLNGSGRRVVIEMAASSGLTLVPPESRDPKITTTIGVGDQISAALAHHHETLEIILGLGGSATNDGGAGMAAALGVKFLDKNGKQLAHGGADLIRLERIDISKLDPRAQATPFTIACDVRSPLCGPQGASFVFGRQKGASADEVQQLDEALAHYAEVIRRDLGKDVAAIPGAGAAGGLGAGCLAFLNATLKPGIELVLDTVRFDDIVKDANLVITGEGRVDDQTLMGKVAAGVAARAAKLKIPCIAVGGGVAVKNSEAMRELFVKVESLAEFAGSEDAAMLEGARWLENLARERAGHWLS